MYGKKRPYVLVFFPETVIGFQINGRKRRLPVVAVHNVGIKIQKRHNFKHAAREKRKTLPVVIISVTAGAFEIELVIYEIERYAVLNVRENPAILVTPGEMHV